MTEAVWRAEEALEKSEESKQYVTFSLNNEFYAFEALRVQEIIELTGITKVPHLPPFLKGVINLRGAIIPVIDLKVKFGMGSGEYRKHTCIIVTKFSRGIMGVIVDSVSDVLHVSDGAVEAAPSFGAKIKTDYIIGIGKVDKNLVIILDADRVLTDEEISVMVNELETGEPALAQ